MSRHASTKASHICGSLRFLIVYRLALLTSAGYWLSHLSRLVLPGPFLSFSNLVRISCLWSLAFG